MHKDIDINLHHIARVEGHGNVVINIKDGTIKELRLEIIESPRFFEVMLNGRNFLEAPRITSRICGICAVGHTTASLRAVEDALRIKISEQTKLLRKIMLYAEIIQSHILHLFFLVLPDLFNQPSVIPLIKTAPDIVKLGLEIKRCANEICAIIGGRHIHPIAMEVGGFSRSPSKKELNMVLALSNEIEGGLNKVLDLFTRLSIPQFNSDSLEFVSLSDDSEYALYEGDILSSNGERFAPKDYRQKVKEFVVQHSTAKHVAGPYIVGALARINNNLAYLANPAKDAAKRLGLVVPCANPFMNNIAQLVECAHCCHEIHNMADVLIKEGLKETQLKISANSGGRGVGAVEVPRGTLYHEYEIDRDGRIINANCIIPTGQNLAHIEQSIRQIVPQILDSSKDDIIKTLEMLVRAYDPCISCSTHFLDVVFV